MKNFFPIVAACALAVATLMPADAAGQTTADHVVTINVLAINAISVGSGVNLQIDAAAAGNEPTSVTGGSTWSMTTNLSSMKVTAELDQDTDVGLTLEANLTAPAGSGTSAGYVALSTTAQDVVNSLSQVAGSGMALTYQATATVDAAVQNQAYTVTYTLTTDN